LPWYYKYVKAALLADLNNFMLIMSFPLTAANRNYEIYKVIAFPSKNWKTYVRYKLESEYLAVSTFQETYVTLSESDYQQCEGETNKICPADNAVTGIRTKSCALSLFLQRQNAREVCKRIVTTQQPAPILRRQGSRILYFTPEPQGVHFRCRGTGGWTTDNMLVQGAGLLE
jgi:hypothetical protein